MGDVVYETRPEKVDEETSKELVSEASKVMGAKTQRVWAPFADICDRANGSDKLVFRSDIVAEYKAYFDMLNAKGVDRIVFLSYEYPLPASLNPTYTRSNFMVPDPATQSEAYVEYLNIVYDFYYQVAKMFPNVNYFEVGNEWDISDFSSYLRDPNNNLYGSETVGCITADIMWYANRAVKAVNPDNQILFPGPSGGTTAMFDDCIEWYEKTFAAIESGKYPTGSVDPKTGGALVKTTDPRYYFQIATMHPYPYNLSDHANADATFAAWVADIERCYQVLVDHNYPVKVWFTEFGVPSTYTDTDGETKGWTDADIEAYLPRYFDAMREFEWLETVIMFRTYSLYEETWSPRENVMGMFYSPSDLENLGKPKQTAIIVYKYVMENIFKKTYNLNELYWYYNDHT